MYNRCNFTHKSLIERIRESFGEKFPDILKELFLPLLGLPVRNSMFKRLFIMAPQWALCHRMLTVFKIPGQKKKDIGMCKSLYVVNSGFNQPSFFFFGAITRDVLPVNLDWEHLKTTSCGFFLNLQWINKSWSPQVMLKKHFKLQDVFENGDYMWLHSNFSYIFICVLTPSRLNHVFNFFDDPPRAPRSKDPGPSAASEGGEKIGEKIVQLMSCWLRNLPVTSNHISIRYISGWKESQINLVDGSVSRSTKTKKTILWLFKLKATVSLQNLLIPFWLVSYMGP